MSISLTVSNINRLNRDIADIQKKVSEERKKEATAVSKINQIKRSINKNTSASMLNSKLNQIERLNKDIANSSSKQADLAKKLATKSADLNKQQLQLSKLQEQEMKKQNDLRKKQEQQQLNYQKSITQELELQKGLIANAGLTSSPPSPLNNGDDIEEPSYDVFISHASEDKDEFVRPLAEELIRIGVKVWYDELSLKWGDSLRVSIDKGLANSRFGVIVISSSFIAKKWPEYEVNGLVAREMTGEKVILPIWHKVSKSEVMKYSPTLADKLAMNSSVDEIKDIAQQLKSLL